MGKFQALLKKFGPTAIVAIVMALLVVRLNNSNATVKKITKSV